MPVMRWLLPSLLAGLLLAQTPYQNALNHIQQGRNDLAIPLLEKLLAGAPGDLKARNLLGIALLNSGRRARPLRAGPQTRARRCRLAFPARRARLRRQALRRGRRALSAFRRSALEGHGRRAAGDAGLSELARCRRRDPDRRAVAPIGRSASRAGAGVRTERRDA